MQLRRKSLFNLSSMADILRSNISMDGKIAEVAARNLSLESCPGLWVFDSVSAPYRRSLIEEFALVCGRKIMIPYSMVSYAIGIGIGQLFGGQLSDRFGRLRVLRISLVLVSFALMIIFVCGVSFWMFLFMRVIIAIVLSIGYVSAVSLYVETTDDKHRVTLNFLSGLNFYFLGGPIIVLISYLLQDWRYVHAIAGIIILCYAISCFLVLRESPRWLVAKGRYTAALKVVQWAIRLNTGDSTRAAAVKFTDLKPSQAKVPAPVHKGCGLVFRDWLQFFSSSGTMRRILPLTWIWLTFGMTFYGVTFYSVRLDGNPYIIALAMMFIATPSDLIKFFIVRKFGRKMGLGILLFFASIFMIAAFAAMLIPSAPGIIVIVMATLALGCISAAFMFIYMYSPELFDTMHRGKAIGFCSLFSRIGMISGSFVERLDQLIWRPLPLLTFSVALSLALLASLFMPPDTERTLRDDEVEEEEVMEMRESA